jgi:hypothetical protein
VTFVAVPQSTKNDINVMHCSDEIAPYRANLPLCIILNGSNKVSL